MITGTKEIQNAKQFLNTNILSQLELYCFLCYSEICFFIVLAQNQRLLVSMMMFKIRVKLDIESCHIREVILYMK